MAGQLLQRGREWERRQEGVGGSQKHWAFRNENPAGNSNTISSDLFRDFLQTCHQRNDKWRLRSLLPAFDYPFVLRPSRSFFPPFCSLCCAFSPPPPLALLGYRQCCCFVVARVECRENRLPVFEETSRRGRVYYDQIRHTGMFLNFRMNPNHVK